MKINTLSLILIISFSLTGCIKNKNINVYDYPIQVTDKIKIPTICNKEYKYTLPKVAVLDFTNNSTYGKAKVDDKHSSGAVGIGLGITGFVAGAKENKSSTKRTIDDKLSDSITPLIESIVLNTGGAILYTRNELDKVNDELKLQDSGLIDSNSIVKFGKLSGVQYLITGTIDNATALHRGYTKYTNSLENVANNTQNKELKLATGLLSLGVSLFDGTDIETDITIKIIDVSTSKIIFTKALKNKVKISARQRPTYDQIISGIKNSIKNVMPELENEFSKHFVLQSYITQIRKNNDLDTIIRIKLGTKQKIKKGDKFNIFMIEENIDPLTSTVTCDKIKLPIVLTATDEISEEESWTQLNNNDIKDIKILQLIRKVQ